MRDGIGDLLLPCTLDCRALLACQSDKGRDERETSRFPWSQEGHDDLSTASSTASFELFALSENLRSK